MRVGQGKTPCTKWRAHERLHHMKGATVLLRWIVIRHHVRHLGTAHGNDAYVDAHRSVHRCHSMSQAPFCRMIAFALHALYICPLHHLQMAPSVTRSGKSEKLSNCSKLTLHVNLAGLHQCSAGDLLNQKVKPFACEELLGPVQGLRRVR